jgi:hypothetical protein
MKRTVSIILALILTVALVSCGAPKADVWEDALYLEDTALGEGAKTMTVEVKALDKQVTFTIKTDKTTVGEALFEHELIDGEQGAYGLYIKKVNGMLADYDIDRSYWVFCVNGEYAMSSADSTEIDEKAVYQLEYTK